MLEEFERFVIQQQLFSKSDNILVGVSGGVDSIVLLQLLIKAGYHASIAHCNFQLRAAEADEEEDFVRDLAAKLQLHIHVKHFETQLYAEKRQISIQMAARDLRYNWFNELCGQYGYDVIALGHHLNDQKETFFINLIRGSGLQGLKGMKGRNGMLARPLLFASRDQILNYASENGLAFREDSSNNQTKYLRNKIRHELLPVYASMHNNANTGLLKSMSFLTENHALYEWLVKEKVDRIMEHEGAVNRIDKRFLLESPSVEALLFECLKGFGFSGITIHEIYQCLYSQPGKIFFSSTHRIVINRDCLEIESLQKLTSQKEYQIFEDNDKILSPVHLIFQKVEVDACFKPDKSLDCAQLDMEKIRFPLTLRKKKKKDRFAPFGMKGTKLLSDYFNDLHLTQHQKESVWLLCNSNDDILWVMGHRINQNYSITRKTKSMLLVQMIDSE
ncbi:MAG: tRNA lysidine(34) synthetase TilS [Bacteroidetes bacterium HGW-Bacteroidetes-1]|jgi:tRNA(Ile)-lysidine synthase|nr:MAG: tRNA lysidine(34) synthetase TilS [Bacteroidetes bacterium HGW-Bacteroidetes-1]